MHGANFSVLLYLMQKLAPFSLYFGILYCAGFQEVVVFSEVFHVFLKNHKKANRFFELLPETIEQVFRFFSSSSAIAVLENEQLKTVEMDKSMNYIVVSI